ncbi:VOC family protein [uncultured Serinicoccus sp.]|uniref:VOC family protein n=1 Tax=uncultured Serinicoccus sp. TaxID=735514 RepID=UPI002609B4D9|nr:VOC family protein [uncultured Serinicoccus sp.]
MTTDDTPLTDLDRVFNGFSVDDLDAAEAFYRDVLGVPVERDDEPMGLLQLRLGNRQVLVYPKGEAHRPASYTVLNFPTDDVLRTVRALADRGVEFLRYDGMPQDDLGVVTSGEGPPIAWFADPAGNVHSVIELGPEPGGGDDSINETAGVGPGPG